MFERRGPIARSKMADGRRPEEGKVADYSKILAGMRSLFGSVNE